MTSLTSNKQLELFRAMLRIRRVQERIESVYLEDEMKTPVHLCIGQEAVSVGVCAVLEREDYISSNHRSHGHYLAKGGDLNGLIAELHCKAGGCSKGYGGSMHLVDTAVNHLGSSSIVGGGIPIGTGLGLAIQMRREASVSVVFFGDGAADEGVLYESLNFAMLKQLPVIYVLENNQWSVCSPVSARQPDINIFHRADPELLMTRRIDGNDALAVYTAAEAAVDRARNGKGPSFIECETYRILGHAGCASQDAEGYRDSCEIDEWQANCPVARLQNSLMASGDLAPKALDHTEKEIQQEINAAFAFAETSPLPETDDLLRHLYKE